MRFQHSWSIVQIGATAGTDSFIDTLTSGLLYTSAVAAISLPLALALSAMATRVLNSRVRVVHTAGKLFINLLCDIPLFVQIFVWNFVAPRFLPWDLDNRPLMVGALCVAMYCAAKITRQIANLANVGDCRHAIARILIDETAALFQASCIVLTVDIVDQIAGTPTISQLSSGTFKSCSAALLIYALIHTLSDAAARQLHARFNPAR